jgi:uncharacterized protein
MTTTTSLDTTEKQISEACNSIKRLLLRKNAAYGDSALSPVRIFSTADPTEQLRVRIDDKLSRVARGHAAGEDVVRDLIGYLLLLQIATQTEPAQGGNYVWTTSGNKVSLDHPAAADIHIDDIAYSLAYQARFAGHAGCYSVAQHSVHVSELVAPEHALVGLLHDSTEAYVGDLISPVKRMVPEFSEIEHRFARVIGERFGVTLDPLPAAVKRADVLMGSTEAVDILGIPERELRMPVLDQPMPLFAWAPEYARMRFLDRFAELTGAS